MGRSQFAKGAAALIALARVRGLGRARGVLPAAGHRARVWIAAVAASLLVPIALAAAGLATPAMASTPAPLMVTTLTPLTATAGSAFLAKLDAVGGVKPYSWSLAGGTSLPAGLVLHASTGEISGKPVGPAGTFDFIAEVTDAESPSASATAAESITVTVNPLTVTTVALPTATAGVPYSATLAATGGVAPYSWSIPVGSLPAGLTLHAATGVISGTPKAGGTFTFDAEVTDSEAAAQVAGAYESITVGVAGLVVTTGSTLPNATSGVPYSVKLSAAGGIAAYKWSLASGSLPAGLTLKSGGTLSGTTNAVGLDSFTVQVTDSEAPAVTATENVSLYVVTPMVVPTGLPGATVDQPYDTSLQPAGGLGPYSYAITVGSLPSGLALQPDGEITGQASADGTSSFTVSVTDSENPPVTVTQAESITVTGTPSPALYWADSPMGTIMAVPAGGGAQTVLASGQNGPAGLVVNGGTVYWADSGTGAIMAIPVTGGTPTVLASGQNDPAYVAVDNGTVYWADSGAGTIMAVPEGGGAPTVLASGQPGPAYVAANGGTVYWVDSGAGMIMNVPEGGGTPATLVNDPSGPAYLAVDSGFVYWANGAGQIMAVRAAVGSTPFVLASGQNGGAYVTANGGTVYWTNLSGQIMAAPGNGVGGSTVLASDTNQPAYLAADSSTVYWIDNSTDTIMAVPAAGGTPFVVANTPHAPSYLTVSP